MPVDEPAVHGMCVCVTVIVQRFHGREWACVFISILSRINAEWLPTLVCMPVTSLGCMFAWWHRHTYAESEHHLFPVQTHLMIA